MEVALGLTAALSWGIADFAAGQTSRRIGAFRTLAGMNIAAFAVLGVWLGLAGDLRPERLFTGHSGVAAVGALVGVGGSWLLYRALAIGQMSLVSPISASYAAVTAGLAFLAGDRPSTTKLIGIGIAFVGVLLAATTPPSAGVIERRPWRAPGVPEAVAAAVILGVGFWIFALPTNELGGPTIVWIGRAVAVIGLLSVALARRAPLTPIAGRAWLALLAIGVIDSIANGAYAVGLVGGQPTVVAVLGSLFTAVTVLLAYVFRGERLARWQWVGCATIVIGLVVIAAV